MKKSLTLFALSFAVMTTLGAIEAQPSTHTSSAPWERGCSHFSSDREFVSNASAYCLRQQNQKVCHRKALETFSRCGYSSDYVKLSKRVHAKMLVVLALASAQKGTTHSPS
jgi:hypothetical protein